MQREPIAFIADAPKAHAREGIVSLVGAGPGPADLLTLRALNRIQHADIVVHDRLICAEVLALIPAATPRVYVGKAAGNHAVPQAQIHTLLVAHARMGRKVVRLKGGDPTIFGRGGEEAQALQAANIAFEVIPGISAANGCAASAGIPLTHRDHAHSVTFLPGHLANSADNDTIDWASLARPKQTRVFYMGVERLRHIAASLIAHGLPADTPAAVIQDGARQTQTVYAMPLIELMEHAPAYGERPGLLIISETVALSAHWHYKANDNCVVPAQSRVAV